jgi:hypothetical protein
MNLPTYGYGRDIDVLGQVPAYGFGAGPAQLPGATIDLGYPAEPRRKLRQRRDDDDLITIIMAFLQIKDD